MAHVPGNLFVDGDWVAGSGAPFDVVDPATEEVLATVASASADDVRRAVAAADRAQADWARVAPRDRAEVLRSCWQALQDHRDELAELMVAESGKPLADARGEVDYAAEFFRWNSEEAVRIRGTLATAPSGANRILVHHVPVGVVAMITPWNFPAAMITRKLAPALAAGNGVVVKPPQQTPLTALRLAGLLQDAGVPDGLLNVLPTSDAAAWTEAAVAQAPTRMLSFTGSTAVGRKLLHACADRVLRTVMELGGNGPFVVFDDADLDAAVEGAMLAKMRHSAETCTAANRFYVQSGVAEAFTARFATAMQDVVVGNGLHEGVTCGPMIDRDARDRVEALVDEAVGEGAIVVTGGRRPDGPGWFVQPTVLGNVAADAAITREEIFGPVAPVIPFEDPEEVLRHANDTEMGLAGYVFTRDLARGLAFSERLQVGMVGLNRGLVSDPAAPFGGMKQSGLGREGSTDGILEFTETQYIATQW